MNSFGNYSSGSAVVWGCPLARLARGGAAPAEPAEPPERVYDDAEDAVDDIAIAGLTI